MNTNQLIDYMLKDQYIRRYFGGVCPRDRLPLYVRDQPKIFIVNTDPLEKPGEHWIAVWMDVIGEHFDSIGKKPEKDFEHFLILNSVNYKYNDRKVQSSYSKTCGQFCLFYCYHRCRGYCFEEILAMFSDNLLDNEIKVVRFYERTK